LQGNLRGKYGSRKEKLVEYWGKKETKKGKEGGKTDSSWKTLMQGKRTEGARP